MSDVNEMAQETELQEEKFFGVKTEINTNPSDSIEIEVIDDTPEEDRRAPRVETEASDDETVDQEITDYSKRAGDRISKIKYEYHEERRAKEQALRESQEAVKALQNLMSENQKLKSVVDQGGNVLNKQALNNAQWAKYNAQQTFKKAYEEGDADAMSASQAELAQATLAEQQAGNYAQTMQQQIASQYVEPAKTEQPAQRAVDPEMNQWAQKNPWFMGSEPVHKEMTSYAMYLDQSLQANGVDPAKDSNKYYSSVDTQMKKQFPNFFGVEQNQSVQTEEVQSIPNKRQVNNPVAPATRNSSKNPRKIHLTQSQVSIARRLNITPEQYANQLLKES